MARKLYDMLKWLAHAADLTDLQQAMFDLCAAHDVEHLDAHPVKLNGTPWCALADAAGRVDQCIARGSGLWTRVVLSCFRPFRPVGSKQFDWSVSAARTLLGEGTAHGLENRGFSLPIRGASAQFALFIVNHRAGDDLRGIFTFSHLNDLLLSAHHVNGRALALGGAT